MLLRTIPSTLLLSGLVLLLVGCGSVSSLSPSKIDCRPTAPQLEWYADESGGAYYPKRAHINLLQYLDDLDHCITELQKPQV